MAQGNHAERERREAPGSAQESQAPAALLLGALVIAVAVVLLVFNDATSQQVLDRVSGKLVLVIWIACCLCMLGVSGWAMRDTRNPRNSLADLMPQRVLGGVVFGVAVISSLLFGV